MKAEQNELITRVGPGTPCGDLLRRYWQPVALVDEFNPALDPAWPCARSRRCACWARTWCCSRTPTAAGACWTATARTAAPTWPLAARGRRPALPFHGWKFDAAGRCLDNPGEPTGSKLCERVRQRSYPVLEKAAWCSAGSGPKT
jgi:phthalate 4,5-dioxygenase oxygenase subunit